MQTGLVYPQTEYPTDPAAVRDYAQTAEALGYTHVLAYDHVLGANPDRPGGWSGPYTHNDPFMEPFVLFTYMAAVTTRLGFIPGILILPQRETALVAKQAATLDVLCGGRFRLGVGTGWNEVEYVALAQDFSTRGQRQEEQLEVLRLLWTQELVTFKGRWHDIPDAGQPAARPAADPALVRRSRRRCAAPRRPAGRRLAARLPHGRGGPRAPRPARRLSG